MGDFAGATCSACDSRLDADGFCSNERCGYSTHYQDEPGGWQFNAEQARAGILLRFKDGCVVASPQTKKYHLPGSRGYKRLAKLKKSVFFRDENHARQAGYELSAL
jgi:hypothetical protein